MKKLALLLLAATVIVGCKKSGSSIEVGMRAKVDGTMMNFPDVMAYNSTQGNIQGITIIGDASNGSQMRVVVARLGSAVTTGTYNVGMVNANTTGTGAAVSYETLTAAGSYNSQATVKVTITKLDANHVEGTFSGIMEPEGGTGANKTVTEGSFNAEFF